MLQIPQLNINDFDYSLPKERIALHPLENRSDSKLLVAKTGKSVIQHKSFFQLPELIPQGSLLVLNTSRVIAARIFVKKQSGGMAELLCVEPVKPSTSPMITMNARRNCSWECIVGGKNIKTGDILTYDSKNKCGVHLEAKIVLKSANNVLVEFSWGQDNVSFAQILEEIGLMPLPPYIKRPAESADWERYQTVYSNEEGSVAAPTAGLHFTEEILDEIKQNGSEICELTLHVGPGTFLPVKDENISKHIMHSEQFSVDINTLKVINSTLADTTKKIIAAGTTSLRTLESLYWCGVKLIFNIENIRIEETLTLGQWEPYILKGNYELPSAYEAFTAVQEWLEMKKFKHITGRTSLLIAPGFDFKIVNTLITNFHLPKSTLILLVAAFLGEERWRNVYKEALAKDYRFLSYGDSSLLFRS
ncbi:MAG: S-adenosylmethionine:tRNA ribosyltransferase-isomerase [Ignavibacteria bacterium]|nr:S-adenosylmethionine:tRNA ribosyltransferase-isomerase [Ignavibacteria bacterium]